VGYYPGGQFINFITDLHIHSAYSRACSKQLVPEVLHQWCQIKGITALSTGDFTHPKWMAELKEKLIPAEPGLFQLKPDLAKKMDKLVPASCLAPVRFLLGVEISSIYKKNGRVRKIHNLVFAPSFDVADKINARLEKIGNIKSDGRPILGLDSKVLLDILLSISPEAYLIPAHAWTPWFAVFGSASGFDSLEECFDDLTPHIFAIETGLSSDPLMNWRLTQLDKVALVSNSDAHSPEKLAREGNVINGELSYRGIFESIKKKTHTTLEFFPEEGKYHVDGHRSCEVRMSPQETIRNNGLCTKCNKQVTVGVLHRIEKLADRPMGVRPNGASNFENIIPLKEILGQMLQVGPISKKVNALYHSLVTKFGNEFSILRSLPLKSLEDAQLPVLALGLKRMREGKVEVLGGYDGEFGTITVIKPEDLKLCPQPVLA
jgi:uncharacterized protein (TIGR00375 family)